MEHNSIRKFMVFFGVQYQTVYVKCRTEESGRCAIQTKMPNAVSMELQGVSDGWGYDIDART